MDIQEAIAHVAEKKNFSASQMQQVIASIMMGKVSTTQLASFLLGLRMKGETIEEITTAAKVMQHYASKIVIKRQPLVDIVGTGGDKTNTFNISTTVAFVVAAAGACVAKHGNRSVSSSSGSADVLEKAGLNLGQTSRQVIEAIEHLGIGFIYARNVHKAMRHAAEARKALGIRTIFNLLGPLTNPAGTTHQLIGVYDKKWLEPIANVLNNLGSAHALVVHSQDGLDEISIAATTDVAELRNGKIHCYEINPKDYDIPLQSLNDIVVSDSEQSYHLLMSVLNNQPGPALDIVALNAGAAIYIAGITPSIKEGVALAKQVIERGKAKEKFDALIAF